MRNLDYFSVAISGIEIFEKSVEKDDITIRRENEANIQSIELSLTVPITNSLAFLFTVLGDWWVDRKVISRGLAHHPLSPKALC